MEKSVVMKSKENITTDYLSDLLFDIQHDNDVVFCGEWRKEDIELCDSIKNVLKYLDNNDEY